MPDNEMEKEYNVSEIMRYLPHRYPFLLVDRVTEVSKTGGKGFKNVTINEEFFQGHFPGKPIMPAVLIVEGMAQCAGFIALKIQENAEGNFKDKIILFMMIDKAKFRRPVSPGDRLDYEIEIIKLSPRLARFKGYARVNDEMVAEAELTAMLNVRQV
jgi:3-hydroxyacyl-[acyl-carrier-protein] dehydratase